MVVQSNWSWLPTIYFSAFMLMFLKEQSFTSYQTFAKFGTMFQRNPPIALSGLKSRAHLIRKYSFPSCQASSLHALSRLYVQKGFALSDIHSALWPTNTSGDRPLCVGPTPVSKGFANFSVLQHFSFSVLRQGVQAAHSVLHQRRHWMSAGDIWPDQSDVPAMRPFRFLNSVIHSQRRPYSICHFLKHVWVQRPFSRAKNHKSIWASWTDILSYKCVHPFSTGNG